jgi:hypothetical protein
MSNRSATFRGLEFVVPSLHLLLCTAIQLQALRYEGSWSWFLVFLADFPLSIILMPFSERVPPIVLFGVFGTLWWFLWSRALLDFISKRRAVKE